MRGDLDDAFLRLTRSPVATGQQLNRSPGPALVIALVALAAFGFYAAVILGQVDRMLAPAYDQAFFEELVWNLGHGGGFFTGFTSGSFLGLHFEPLLIVPAVLELGWPDERLLTILNALGLAAAAPAGYLLARQLLPERPWLAVALAGPLPAWAAMQQAGLSDFHPEVLALPVALLAGWAGIRGRSVLCCCLALVALAAKEDQAYTVLVVGVLIAASGRRRLGLLLAGGALLWGLVVVGLVMPAIRAGTQSDVASYYTWLATANPGEVTRALIHPGGWLAFAGLVIGMSGLPLLRARWLMPAFPPLLADLLSSHPTQSDLRLHYGLLLVLPIFAAGLMGARRLEGRSRLPALALAVPALLLAVIATPFVVPVEKPALVRLRACTRQLPPAASVAADDPVSAPLAARHLLAPTAGALPAEYVVVDRVGREPSYVDRSGRARTIAGLPSGGRRLLCDDGRFQLWSPIDP